MSINPKFKLKSSTPEDKPTMISLFVFYNQKRFVYSTGQKIEPKYWDKKNCKVKQVKGDRERNENHKTINRIISDYDKCITDIFKEYTKKGEIPSKENLKNDLNELFKKENEPEPKEYTLNSYIDKFINDVKTGDRLTPEKKERYKLGSIKNFLTFQTQFDLFQESKNKNYNFNDITMDFYDEFVNFFIKKNYAPNTIGKNIKTLKTIMNAARDKGLHNNLESTQKSFKTLKVKVENIYLSLQELEKMYNLDLSKNPNLEQSRDIFLIGSFTSLRFSDYSRIKPSNIKNKGNNNVIEMYTKKTGELVIIPFWHWILEELLIKYKYNIPKIYEQKLNKDIKEVGRLAGINELEQIEVIRGGLKVKRTVEKYKLIMTHTARRSGATNMYKNDIPIIDIMKITSHLTESSFMKYIKITKEETAERIMKNHRITKPLKIAN
jgi:hypothetical protein